METDPQTCLLASGPQGGRPHGDGCDVMKRGGEGGAHLEGPAGSPRAGPGGPRGGASWSNLWLRGGGRLSLKQEHEKGSPSPALGLAPQPQAQGTVRRA